MYKRQPCPVVPQSVVQVLARHIRQSVKYWTGKSTAVSAAAAMMASQPRCSEVIDAILLVPLILLAYTKIIVFYGLTVNKRYCW